MTAIAPSTDIYLLKLPIELDDENQLTFASASAQATYFQSLTKTSAEDTTYQRRDETIRYPAGIDTILQYNYVMYKNVNYSDKWFYARITNMAYAGDEMTAISIEEDTFQTWQFDLVYSQCFVEREHVNDDTFGKHTIPEGLETGEYVRNAMVDYHFGGNYFLAFQVTELISNMTDGNTSGRLYDGIYSGLIVVMVDNYRTADLFVAAYDDAGKRDAIISAFYVPKDLVPSSKQYWNNGVTLHGQTCDVCFPKESNSAQSMQSLVLSRPSTIDGYTPKNNKLFTKEFCYIYATNNSGASATYAFEDFRLNTDGSTLANAQFAVVGALSQGCSIKVYPSYGYKAGIGATIGGTAAYSYGLPLGKLPLASWNSDYYTNWCTQNAVNFAVEPAQRIAAGFAGGILSGVGSIFNTVTDLVAKHYEADIVPNQAKGDVGSGDINFSSNAHLQIINMSVRKEYAAIIDGYLSAYGYKINEIKTPNITGRTNWNYVKTAGSAIHAYIPQNAVDKINKMFDNGITLWHNASTFRDYSQSNTIVTP